MKNNNNAVVKDNELFRLAKNGDENALNTLYGRYLVLGRKIAGRYFVARSLGTKFLEEYIPEIDFVFLNAFRSYSPRKGSFRSFFAAILYNSVNRFIGREILTNDLLRDCVSLDRELDGCSYHEVVGDPNDLSPLSYYQNREFVLRISSPDRGVDAKEVNMAKRIYILKMIGYRQREISKILGIPESKVSKIYVTNIKRIGNKNS